MASARSSGLLREVRTLFGAGTITGLSDGQLLERFRSRSATANEAARDAEAAFEAIVARHGPMVLGVCRRALADPEEIDDAFQATFLVLVRRADTVRVDDSLGRWLYGVARRVAAKAGARSQRLRGRFSAIEVEPIAPTPPPDLTMPLAALDEELGRLPAKYRDPVVLCHLEGLTHAEAAARLRWPVGTVSGRLSRARDLLRQRLTRRGLAPTAGSLVAVLAPNGTRAAVPEPLAAATARAAACLTRGGMATPGAASAAAVALMDEVLRAAVVVKLKAAAAVVLAGMLAGAAIALAMGVPKIGAGPPRAAAGDRETGQSTAAEPAAKPAPATAAVRSPGHRPADEIVREIEQQLKAGRGPLMPEDWDRIHGKIAELAQELWTFYPDDPRVAGYLPQRWLSLSYINRRDQALAEIRAVLLRPSAPELRRSAVFTEVCLRSQEPRGGGAAVAVAEAFAREAPGDKRAGELFYMAADRLDGDVFIRVALAAALVLSLAVAAAVVRWRRPLIRLGELALVVLVIAACGLRLKAGDRQGEILTALYDRLTATAMSSLPSPVTLARFLPLVFGFVDPLPQLVRSLISGWTALAVVLAAAAGIAMPVRPRRAGEGRPRRMARVRAGVLGFVAALAALLSLDAGILAWQARAIRGRIVRDYPDSFRGRIVQGQRRQRSSLGEPFDLEFDDAITGRHISLKDLRGKVVVVEFWATWCGPCLAEIPEMLRLYETYRGRGVEFVGVSLDAPEENGGLKSLRKEVKERNIPWPQYYLAHDTSRIVTGEPIDDFAESWGINLIPTVFLIDAEGKLYSTEARGRLDTLIPRLLERSRPSSPGR